MVAVAYKYTEIEEIKEAVKDPLFLPSPLQHGVVSIKQIIDNGHRFDASVYNMDAIAALDTVKHNPYGYIMLLGEFGLIDKAYVGGRFKRIYTDKTSDIPFYMPSDIESIYAKPSKFISRKTDTDIDSLRVCKDMLVMTVSGTIGKTSLIGKTLDNQVFSHDLLRITFKNKCDLGYVYAFLNTDVGLTILQSNNYGAVIDHIEPEHLSKVPIPNAPESEKKVIHDLIVESFNLRDQSNDLIDEAQAMLHKELGLTAKKDEIKPTYYSDRTKIRAFTIKASQLDARFDVSYHLPEISETISLISRNADEVTTLGDSRITSDIILPGRFKRIYVDKAKGIPFFGGKQLLQLNPSNMKYLSLSHHGERISSELMLKENMCAITCSGTIGKIAIVPKHWSNWAMNQHVMRVVPASDSIAGYIYAWLDTPYSHTLITRNVYGAVVDEIDSKHIANVCIPLLKDKSKQKKINDLVLKANSLRYQAYIKEQDTIKKMNEILGIKTE